MPAKTDWTALAFILACVLFTVYGQVIIKARVSALPQLPAAPMGKVRHLLMAFSDLWILSGLAAAFVASAFWIMALSRGLPLSYAYPFTSLSFVLVIVSATLIFGEQLTGYRIAGVSLIVAGVALSAQSPA